MNSNNLTTLLQQISQLSKHYEEIANLSGENFNIFQIIKLTTEEVRIHSRFLAELLNSKGSHGQGSLFLQLFIKQLNLKEIDYSNYKVSIEKHIGSINEERNEGGILDIIISDYKNNCIVIENKINAGDQDKQLVRYSNYCKGYKNSSLIYLTLDGKDAQDYSKENLVSGTDYQVISYSSDIILWLENCRKEVATLPIIREGITHYINLIKHLTNQSINKIMKDEILKIIINNPESLEAANIMAREVNRAKHAIQWKFWKALRLSLESKGLKVKSAEEDKKTVTSEKTYLFYNKQKNNYPGLWIEVFRKDDISIHWGAEIESNLYVGFTVEYKGEGGISNKAEFAQYREIVCNIDSEYKTESPYWLGWKYTEPLLDFRSFSTEQVYNLADDTYLQSLISDITEKAVSEIAQLKSQLKI